MKDHPNTLYENTQTQLNSTKTDTTTRVEEETNTLSSTHGQTHIIVETHTFHADIEYTNNYTKIIQR